MLRAFLICSALVPLASGCVAVAAAGIVGMGVVQFERNEVAQDFPTALQETWEATLEGLRRLDMEPEESELGPTEGHLRHGEIHVLVERHPEPFTRVRVRVNTFHTADNERRALLILQEVENSLRTKDELRAWVEKVQGQPKGQEAKPTAAEPKAPAAKPAPKP